MGTAQVPFLFEDIQIPVQVSHGTKAVHLELVTLHLGLECRHILFRDRFHAWALHFKGIYRLAVLVNPEIQMRACR